MEKSNGRNRCQRTILEEGMIVQVKAFANFRDILGGNSQVELMEGSTVEELLKNLSLSHRRFESAIFDESGEVREHIIIMKNRKDVASIGGLQTALSEGDEVAILPPVSGG